MFGGVPSTPKFLEHNGWASRFRLVVHQALEIWRWASRFLGQSLVRRPRNSEAWVCNFEAQRDFKGLAPGLEDFPPKSREAASQLRSLVFKLRSLALGEESSAAFDP